MAKSRDDYMVERVYDNLKEMEDYLYDIDVDKFNDEKLDWIMTNIDEIISELEGYGG